MYNLNIVGPYNTVKIARILPALRQHTEVKVYMYVCARLCYCQGQVTLNNNGMLHFKAVSGWLNPHPLEHLVRLRF